MGEAQDKELAELGSRLGLTADFLRCYEPLGVLGEGGMGVVLRCRDRKLDRLVAVKFLKDDYSALDPTAIRRFVDEGRICARLRHPNVVQLYASDHVLNALYLVYEFVEGETLGARMERAPGHLVPLPAALELAVGSAAGLGHAHEQGIVHRDVKPQNILIAAGDVAKVADFGIARDATTGRRTKTGIVVGTPTYMAPEQIKGTQLGPRADVYALSVVLYELFGGKVPYEGAGMEVLRSHVDPTIVPEPLGALNPQVPPALAQVVSRGLEKDPDMRWADGHELSEALLATRADVLAARPSCAAISATVRLREPTGPAAAAAPTGLRTGGAPRSGAAPRSGTGAVVPRASGLVPRGTSKVPSLAAPPASGAAGLRRPLALAVAVVLVVGAVAVALLGSGATLSDVRISLVRGRLTVEGAATGEPPLVEVASSSGFLMTTAAVAEGARWSTELALPAATSGRDLAVHLVQGRRRFGPLAVELPDLLLEPGDPSPWALDLARLTFACRSEWQLETRTGSWAPALRHELSWRELDPGQGSSPVLVLRRTTTTEGVAGVVQVRVELSVPAEGLQAYRSLKVACPVGWEEPRPLAKPWEHVSSEVSLFTSAVTKCGADGVWLSAQPEGALYGAPVPTTTDQIVEAPEGFQDATRPGWKAARKLLRECPERWSPTLAAFFAAPWVPDGEKQRVAKSVSALAMAANLMAARSLGDSSEAFWTSTEPAEARDFTPGFWVPQTGLEEALRGVVRIERLTEEEYARRRQWGELGAARVAPGVRESTLRPYNVAPSYWNRVVKRSTGLRLGMPTLHFFLTNGPDMVDFSDRLEKTLVEPGRWFEAEAPANARGVAILVEARSVDVVSVLRLEVGTRVVALLVPRCRDYHEFVVGGSKASVYIEWPLHPFDAGLLGFTTTRWCVQVPTTWFGPGKTKVHLTSLVSGLPRRVGANTRAGHKNRKDWEPLVSIDLPWLREFKCVAVPPDHRDGAAQGGAVR